MLSKVSSLGYGVGFNVHLRCPTATYTRSSTGHTTPQQNRDLTLNARCNGRCLPSNWAIGIRVSSSIRTTGFKVNCMLTLACSWSLHQTTRSVCSAQRCTTAGLLWWVEKYWHWTMDQCGRVFFSDKSLYNLQSDWRRKFVWREHWIRYNPQNITERNRYLGSGVLVSAGVMLNGSRTIIVRWYRDEVLISHVWLWVVQWVHHLFSWLITHDVNTQHCSRG